MVSRTYYTKRYEKLRKQGLCPICGGRRDSFWITCSKCRKRNRMYQSKVDKRVKNATNNRYRHNKIAEGRCFSCANILPEQYEYTRCPTCKAKEKKHYLDRKVKLAMEYNQQRGQLQLVRG